MSKRGRPSLLDAQKRKEVCSLVKVGCPLSVAAEYVGVSPGVIRYALRHNPEFAQEVKRAQVTSEVVPLANVHKAGASRWQAAAWFLERTQPERYGRRKPNVVTHEAAWNLVHKGVDYVLEEFKQHPAIGRRVEAAFRRWGDEYNLKCRINVLPGNERFSKHKPRKPEDEEIIARRP